MGLLGTVNFFVEKQILRDTEDENRKKQNEMCFQAKLFFLYSWIFIFWRRHRDFKYTSSPYQAQFDSISLSNNQFTCNVLDISQNILFKLELVVLDNNKIRFKFNELNPLKKRYEVENSLVGEPKRIR